MKEVALAIGGVDHGRCPERFPSWPGIMSNDSSRPACRLSGPGIGIRETLFQGPWPPYYALPRRMVRHIPAALRLPKGTIISKAIQDRSGRLLRIPRYGPQPPGSCETNHKTFHRRLGNRLLGVTDDQEIVALCVTYPCREASLGVYSEPRKSSGSN